MKLTLKIILLFLVVSCGLIWVSGYLSVQREIAFFEEEMTARHGRLVAAVEPMLLDAWRSAGPGGLLRFVANIEGDERQVRIRWVWLDVSADDLASPVAPRTALAKIPLGQLTSIAVRAADGAGLYCSYFPFELGDGRRGALEMAESLARRDQYTRNTIQRTAALLVAMLLAALLLVAIFGLRLIGQPLQALLLKTQQIAEGDLRTPVIVPGSDELATLATALNDMSEKLDSSQNAILKESAQRIEAMEQLRHGDRLRTVGRLASGLAHELGTPLNVVSGRAGLILGGKLSGEDVLQSAQTIKSEATRMTTIVQQLLNFARRSPPNRVPCHLNTVIDQTVSLMESMVRKKDAVVQVEIQSTADVMVRADAAQLQQVLSNLLMNSMLAKDSPVHILIRAEQCSGTHPESSDRRPMKCVKVSVIDNGDGISEANLPHVFEPFFTTRDVGQGTGLGLSIVHGIIAEHGGWMSVQSTLGKGTTFAFFLPLEEQS